jgi:hypothetical protein
VRKKVAHMVSAGFIWLRMYVCVYICMYMCVYVCMYVGQDLSGL